MSAAALTFLLVDPPPAPPSGAGGLAGFLQSFEALIPVPAMLVVVPLLWLLFRNTWRELDYESHQHRAAVLGKGSMDHRPLVAMVLCALILTWQDKYGGRDSFIPSLKPFLKRYDDAHGGVLQVDRYEELWSFAWWSFTRVAGYVLIPFPIWKLFFPQDSLADFGLRVRGFFSHAWIYLLFLSVVLPAMLIVSSLPDFAEYYPFYKTASRSWFDFLAWEAMYFLQFFALEMFFRGFWLGALKKSFGSGAIFAMAVPYCMIHFRKPYLEINGAIVAGIALGSLSIKTRSIYQGFLVHVTVAGLMDWLALAHRKNPQTGEIGMLPKTLWPAPPPGVLPDGSGGSEASELSWLTLASDLAQIVAIAAAVLAAALLLRIRVWPWAIARMRGEAPSRP